MDSRLEVGRWTAVLVVSVVLGCASDPEPSATVLTESTDLRSAPDTAAGAEHLVPPPKVEPLEVLTSKNDNGRTGTNRGEEQLSVANVRGLVLRATLPVDGELYAQPLVAGEVDTPSGRKTLVVAATMNDSVFAFDLDAPDGSAPVWHVGKSGELGTPGQSTRNVFGPNGILSTPVISGARERVYVVARDCNPDVKVTVGSCANVQSTATCRVRLFALALGTGAVVAETVIAGAGFEPAVQWNRPGLLLEGDGLFVAFGSGPNGNQHEEDFVYHGYLFRYDAADLTKPPAMFNTTPTTRGGSVWQAGTAPASDGKWVYFTAANRTLDCKTHPPGDFPPKPTDFEDSVLRLPLDFATETAPSQVLGYADTRPYTAAGFTGTVFQFTNAGDVGFGSSGPALIPGTEDLLVSSKGGLLYVLDRHTLTPRHPPLSPFSTLPLQGDHALYVHSWSGIPVVYGALAISRPRLADGLPAPYALAYGWAQDELLRAFRYDDETHALTLHATAAVPAMPGGGFMSVSTNDGKPGSTLVWATTRTVTGAAGQGHLWAFDGETLETLWETDTPAFSKFTPPTVVRGRVLVASALTGGAMAVLVYSLP